MDSKNRMINDYFLIDCDDDAIYLAKSKQDVLNYWKEYYGTPMELVGETDEEFLEGLTVLDLSSEEVQKSRLNIHEELPDYMKIYYSYYDTYSYHAHYSETKCKPILWYSV